MEEPLERKLQRLIKLGIIERVESSKWATPIVIVRKPNGEIRLCADYSTGVNCLLVDNRHPLPNVESATAKLNGNAFFSVLDLSDAFFQLEIAEDHREITTIITPFGLFRYTRVPFGLKTASAEFQEAMDNTLAGLDGVDAYLDDVIVRGSNRREHDLRFRKTLQRLEERGWKLRLDTNHTNHKR
ncbi:uncharacterized protein K02A2.6-like [Temnothorax curvispinosus]|uniref:Uncharacterized protein K02A2.6-like n=1 Tax=Temnothorax curvispinosus TaxID=300111 RepID=A0A6J1RKI9_9HYME|nr:uncharacterized protein K02A2.6-like [Temnothorax curvispinosus]